MMKIVNPNILILGIGSTLGYSLVKQIKTYDGVGNLYLGNGNNIFAARALSDKIIITPDFYDKKDASKQEYIDFIFKFVENKKIDILMCCIIGEIEVLYKFRREFEKLGCRILIESDYNIETFFDKLNTIKFFHNNGINALETVEIFECNGDLTLPNINFPFFIKPRFGYGSNGLALIRNEEEFQGWSKFNKIESRPYIAQTYLDEKYNEYTCTCTYRLNGEVKDLMVLERKKIERVTTIAQYSPESEQIEPIIREIASKIRGLYVLNFQFKMVGNIPFVFEINPRFAAGEAIRIKFGKDLFYSLLSEYCMIEKKNTEKVYGTVFRIYDEVLIPMI